MKLPILIPCSVCGKFLAAKVEIRKVLSDTVVEDVDVVDTLLDEGWIVDDYDKVFCDKRFCRESAFIDK